MTKHRKLVWAVLQLIVVGGSFLQGMNYARSVSKNDPNQFADFTASEDVSLTCWREKAAANPNKRYCWTINWKQRRDCEAALWFLTTSLPILTEQGALKSIEAVGQCGPQAQLPKMNDAISTQMYGSPPAAPGEKGI